MAEDPFELSGMDEASAAGVASRDEVDDEEWLRRMRHSAAHVLAQVVLDMFPDAK